MIKYEAYNDIVKVQFLIEQEALDYANVNELLVRTIEEKIVNVIEPNKQDWLNLEQSFYTNINIFSKALNSTGNGFAFLSKVFADGKTTFASQNALISAISLLRSLMLAPYTQEEIDFINLKFEENNFTVRLS